MRELLFAAAILLLLSVACESKSDDELYVYTGAWSHHVGSDYDYNQDHDLIAVEYKNVFVGFFKNSFAEDAFAAGYKIKRTWGDFEGSVLFGGTYGYRDCFSGYADAARRVCPVVVPSLAYTAYKVQPTVMILGNALAISVRFEL